MNETKEKILQSALDLFSQKGFSAVSIRDICALVHIKESTVYYHVQNKEAILDELLNRFENRSQALIDRMSSLFPRISSGEMAPNDLFSHIISAYVDDYLADPFCNKVIRLLSIDQLHNPRVQKLYVYWLFTKPLEIQISVILFLQSIGTFPPVDANLAAEQFYAPIFFSFSRYLLTGDLTEEKIQSFKTAINTHRESLFT